MKYTEWEIFKAATQENEWRLHYEQHKYHRLIYVTVRAISIRTLRSMQKEMSYYG